MLEELDLPLPPPIVHEENNSWYFWDETWTNRHGPFASRDEAETMLEAYLLESLAPREALSEGEA